jgi:hypothetical protein
MLEMKKRCIRSFRSLAGSFRDPSRAALYNAWFHLWFLDNPTASPTICQNTLQQVRR